ncbi:MAG: hypothetical protein LBV52_05030 [Spirochaetaceae bacterium]|jgi:hypothetical protein|nr:hypothetical protein [Spirochaetaceae bacterium]
MNLPLVITLIVLTTTVILFLFFFFWNLFAGGRKKPAKSTDNKMPEGVRGEARVCPICAVLFLNGETVKSKRFPSSGRFDRMLHIHGCPYCLKGERTRICPVCGDEIGVSDYLIARIFERPGKAHVHVLGCTKCRIGKKN